MRDRSDPAAPAAAPDRWTHDHVLHAWWVEPGSVLAGEFPGHVDPGRAARNIDLLVDHGIRTFVDLTSAADGLVDYAGHLTGAAVTRQLDLRHARHPIPDFGVVDHAGYDGILGAIADARTRGGVYVHCWGGVGRTGTVVGCVLIDQGLDVDAALARLVELRAGTRRAGRRCPESDAQLALLRRRAERT